MKTNKNIPKSAKTDEAQNKEKKYKSNREMIYEACLEAERFEREEARKQTKKLLPWGILILLPLIVCLVLLYIYHGIGAVIGSIGAIFIVFTICAIYLR